MRTLTALLLIGGLVAGQSMGPAKAVDTWTSKPSQKRLRLEWEALPEYKPTKLPDGSEEPPRAPWPFLLYIQEIESKGSEKLHTNVLLDTRFVLATRAVKPVRLKPAKAIELPYLAQVSGIRDPTLIVVSRDFEVVGAVKTHKDFTAKKVLPLLAKAADEAYDVKLSRWVGSYIDLLEDGEKLWKEEMKVDELRERAGREDKAKAAKYDKQADELEEELKPKQEELANRFLDLEQTLRVKSDEAAPLPTTFGSGKEKRKLTPEELEAIEAYREFSRNDNPIVRAAAVEDLGAVDSPVMVETILTAANDVDPRVTEAAGKALGRMSSPEALEAMMAGLSHSNSKARQAAVYGFASNPRPYPAAVPHLVRFLKDSSADMRRYSVQALQNQKDPSAAAALIETLDDSEPAIRVLAATALGELKAAQATKRLCECLESSDWSLQKAAAEALGKIRTKECIEPLLVEFEKSDGLLTEVLYKALVAVTGQDFKYSAENWRKWWDRWGEGFKVPTEAQIVEARKKAEEALKGYFDPRKKRKYHKIETLSRKMVFVIDISASMNDKIVIPPYAPDEVKEEFPDRVKWNIAEKELTEILATLDRNVWFNIITFAGKVDTWRDGMVSGSSRTTAIKYVAKLKPLEASSGTGSAGGGRRGGGGATGRPGGGGAGGDDEQKTNTYAALMAAFGLADEEVPNWRARTKVDTIFLVTDGIPTIGKITDVPKLVQFFTELNRTRGVIIHVIVFDKDAAKKLRPLAEQNGGQCVIRGWDGTIAPQK